MYDEVERSRLIQGGMTDELLDRSVAALFMETIAHHGSPPTGADTGFCDWVDFSPVVLKTLVENCDFKTIFRDLRPIKKK